MDFTDQKSTTFNTAASPELPPYLLAKLRVEVPGYQLLNEIASGGQATVYRARELTSGLTVAIKILHAGPNADPDSRERFRREAAALKALNHPNIVCVIESGQTPAGLDFLVMNYIEGKPLDVLWKDRKLAAKIAPEPPARLRLFKKICDIVQAAHRAGITHRDLSPSNILLDDRGEPQVLDFGLAATAFDAFMSPGGRNITVTGQFIGKLKYASPEQARGTRDSIDIRTDVYALGVILYQILTNGAFPYEVVGNVVDVLNNIIHSKPMPPSALLAARNSATVSVTPGKAQPMRHDPPLVNETIEAVVLKALEKNPADRYESAGALGEDIERYLAGTPTSAKPRNAKSGVRRKPPYRFSLRAIFIASLLAILTIGVLMKTRNILNAIGLSAVAACLGLGPASSPNAPDLSPVEHHDLLQLADDEANIQAINKALKLTGYNVGIAYDQLDSSQHANEIMNRKGGGPVRWDDFYGKTAKAYARNGNGWYGDHRPEQFAYVYQANNDQIAKAQDKIATLAQNQAALLERRGMHEADQSRLWARLAWSQVKDREIDLEPLCRFTLKPSGSQAAVLRQVIMFLRTADAVAEDGLSSIDTDQDATFQRGNQRMSAAYSALQLSLADALDAADLQPDQVKEGKALKAICKTLSEDCQVIALNYTNALDRDKAKEDGSKLEFRGQLQASLADFAAEVGHLDDEVSSTARAWGVTADRSTPAPVVVAEERVPAASASSGTAISASLSWTNLLDPTQFGKWTVPDSNVPPLQLAADGSVTLTQKGIHAWGTPARDAIIRVKVRIDAHGSCKLFLRLGASGERVAATGYEGVLSGDTFAIRRRDGGANGLKDLATAAASRPYTDFFEMQFSAIGNQLVLSVDGQQVLEARDATYQSGTVGIGGSEGTRVFKEVRLQILDQAQTPAAEDTSRSASDSGTGVGQGLGEATGTTTLSAPADGEKWVALIGDDKAGWEVVPPERDEDWQVENGLLRWSGNDRSLLSTKRDDYRNFHLNAEVRLGDKQYAQLKFRNFEKSEESPRKGYTVVLNCTNENSQKTGTLGVSGSGVVTQVMVAPVPADSWFTLEVTAVGSHVVVKVNGQTTADYVDPGQRFSSGHIALSSLNADHAPGRYLEIRNFKIQELPAGSEQR